MANPNHPDEIIRRCRAAAWEWSGGRCWYCGTETLNWRTLDRVDPQGKAHDPANMLPACNSCNTIKGTKSLEEFRRRQAEDKAIWPYFTPAQRVWLYANVALPDLPRFEFYGERAGLTRPWNGKPKEHPSNDFQPLPTKLPTTSDELEVS